MSDKAGIILAVNDDADQLELPGPATCRAGYRVLTAADGDEGLKVARRERPHLIISDVSMPRTDGIELCRWVRADRSLVTINNSSVRH